MACWRPENQSPWRFYKQASTDLVYLCSTHLNLLDRELGGDDPATTFGATFYNEKVDFRALFLVCRRRMKRWFS